MRITFLGTGSSTPSPKQENKPSRSFSGMLIDVQGTFLLFDIGPGTVSKMQQIGIDTLHKPTHLFISHFHIDHCLDYVALAKDRALADFFGQNITPLSVFGPQGLKELSDDLFKRMGKWSYMDQQLKVYEVVHLKETMDGIVAEGNSWKVSCKPIKHYNGNAYLLEAEGKRVIYSGDMEYDETIATLGQGADAAILECSYPDRPSLQGKGAHLCPEDIGELAIKGNFQRTFLTHLYPACEGREAEMVQKIEGMSPTKVTIAYDFMTIDL